MLDTGSFSSGHPVQPKHTDPGFGYHHLYNNSSNQPPPPTEESSKWQTTAAAPFLMIPPSGAQPLLPSGHPAEERASAGFISDTALHSARASTAAGAYTDGTLSDSLLPDYDAYVARMLQAGDVSSDQRDSPPFHVAGGDGTLGPSGSNVPPSAYEARNVARKADSHKHSTLREDPSWASKVGHDPDGDDSISEYEEDTRPSHQLLDDSPQFGQRTSLKARASLTSVRSLREQRSATSLGGAGSNAITRPLHDGHRPVIRRSPTCVEDATDLKSPRVVRSNSLGGMAAGKNAENYAAPAVVPSPTLSSVAERNRLRQSLTGRKPPVKGPSVLLRNERELEVEMSEFSNGATSQMSETNGETSQDDEDRPRAGVGNAALRAAATAAMQHHHHHPLDNHPHHYRQGPAVGGRLGADRDPVPDRKARNITLGKEGSGFGGSGGGAAAAAPAAGLETVSRLKSGLKKGKQMFPAENGWAQGSNHMSQTQPKRHITFGGEADEFT